MRFTLYEAAAKTGLEPDLIIRFVSQQWIIPVDWDHQVVDEEDLARVQLIYELQRDFGVNDEAVPLLLHLIDQLNLVHLELKAHKDKND